MVTVTGRWWPSVAKSTSKRLVYTGDRDAAQANSNYFYDVFAIHCVGVLNRKIWSGKYCTTILIVLNFSKKLHALQGWSSVIRSSMRTMSHLLHMEESISALS